MSELFINGSRDQALPTDETEILTRVERVIQDSIDKQNAFIALNACRDLIAIQKLSGYALAKFLYMIKNNWTVYNLEESFEDTAYEYLGLHAYTIDRYLSVWSLREGGVVPEHLVESLFQRNIKDVIPIAKTIEQGFNINEDRWEELTTAADFTEVSKIIREDIKGMPPKRGSIQIEMDEVGTLWAWKDGDRYFIGSLELDDDDEVVQYAIKRLTSNAGVIKR